MTVLFSGLVSSITSLIVTSVINILFQYRNSKKRLDDTLMQLNQLMLNNPFLENDNSLERYLKREKIDKNELCDKYNIFCIMKYNYLEDYCRFYKFNISRIKKHIHLKEYLGDNKEWWSKNRTINYEAYEKKFIHIIEEVVNEA